MTNAPSRNVHYSSSLNLCSPINLSLRSKIALALGECPSRAHPQAYLIRIAQRRRQAQSVDGGTGHPIAITPDSANRHDMRVVCPAIDDLQLDWSMPRPDNPRRLCLDKGYHYAQVRQWAAEFGFIAHIRARGKEALKISNDAEFRARRRFVSRTHGWMNRSHGLLIR